MCSRPSSEENLIRIDLWLQAFLRKCLAISRAFVSCQLLLHQFSAYLELKRRLILPCVLLRSAAFVLKWFYSVEVSLVCRSLACKRHRRLIEDLSICFWYGSLLAIFIISILVSCSHQSYLVVLHMSTIDCKSPQVSRTLLRILVYLNNTVNWMVSVLHLILYSENLFSRPLGTVRSALIKIGIIITIIIHRNFSS